MRDNACVVSTIPPIPSPRKNEQNDWQSRFYDHIIRNEQSYQTISEYIINNPAKWEDDKFFE